MVSKLRFDNRVIVVTGAGRGLGREYALLFGALGGRVVVNDLGTSTTGVGFSETCANLVVEEIRAAGGDAIASVDSVEDGSKIIETAMTEYGRVDVIVNNAGVLRDSSFHKMTEDDWESVYRVHLYGSYKVTRSAWPIFREQQYGRIVFITSASGIYGNFGQANYAASKLGLYGLTRTLAIEGASRNIHVNALAPAAASRMTDALMPIEVAEQLPAKAVCPVVAYLSHETCADTGGLFDAHAGHVRRYRWERSDGIQLDEYSIDEVSRKWSGVNNFSKSNHPADAAAAVSKDVDLSSARQSSRVDL